MAWSGRHFGSGRSATLSLSTELKQKLGLNSRIFSSVNKLVSCSECGISHRPCSPCTYVVAAKSKCLKLGINPSDFKLHLDVDLIESDNLTYLYKPPSGPLEPVQQTAHLETFSSIPKYPTLTVASSLSPHPARSPQPEPSTRPTLGIQPATEMTSAAVAYLPPSDNEMVSAGAHLPPWHRGNVQQEKYMDTSQYKEVLNQSRIMLRNNLRLADVWPHLHQMGVITQNDEDRLRLNAPNCESVDRLIAFINTCQKWSYHSLLRAMALTQQGHLIPQGGLPPEVYMEGIQPVTTDTPGGVEQHSPASPDIDRGPPPAKQHFYKKANSDIKLPISADLLPALLRHCEVSEQYLMKAPLFGFHDDITIDVTRFHICTDAQCTYNKECKTIGWRELFSQLFTTERHTPNTLLIEGEAGSGKTTFLEDYARRHCKEFTECEGKGPESPCVGHEWKIILYIPAGSISGSQEAAIQENLHCDEKHKDQVLTMIKDGGEGVLVINDGLDELRKEAEKMSLRQYTISHQKGGRPKVLNTARHGLCPIEGKYIDRKVTLNGFSVDQGIQYLEMYLEEAHAHLVLLEYIKQQKTELKWVLTNPLRVHIFSHLIVSGDLKLDEIRNLTTAKLLKVLEAFVLKRDEKCREADTRETHSDQFYRLCLELLLRDERIITDQQISSDSPYAAFLNMHKKINLYAHEERYFKFGHELFLEYFSIQGLCQYIKSNPSHKKALLLCLCANPNMRNVLQVMCGHISEYEPELHQDLAFIIQACIILQATFDIDGGRWQQSKRDNGQQQHMIINILLQLPGLVKKIPAADIIKTALNEEQMTMMMDIAEEVEAAFIEEAEILKSAGWFLHVGYEKSRHAEPTALLRFIMGCIRQCVPSLQEKICSQSIHRLLPTAVCKVEDMIGSQHDYSVFPVSAVRWAMVDTCTGQTIIQVWCPSDVAPTLKQCYTQHPPPTGGHNVDIHLGYPASLWGIQPPEVLLSDQWLPALCELFTHRVDRVTIFTDHVSRTTPLDGLLSALQQVPIPVDSLTRGIEVWNGQVSEEVLVGFCEWTCTVNLKVQLVNITVLLSADRDEHYVTRLHQRVQHVMHRRPPTYKTPAGHTIGYTV